MAIGHKEAYDKDSDSVRMRHMLFGLHQKLVVDGCWLAPTLTMQQLLSSSFLCHDWGGRRCLVGPVPVPEAREVLAPAAAVDLLITGDPFAASSALSCVRD